MGWQQSRMAADYIDVAEVLARTSHLTNSLVVGGIEVGGSYDPDPDFVEDSEWGLPSSYFKQFSSAQPTPRAGYDRAAPLPTESEPERGDAYLGGAAESLMKGPPKPNHVVSKNGESLPCGGGSSTGGRRARKKVGGSNELVASDSGDAGVVDQRHLGRFIVYGLTKGEAEFYQAHPGEARAVLQQLVALVTIEKRVPEKKSKVTQIGKPRPNFAVYGISKEQAETLAAFPGSARAALIEYAHGQDGGRIRDRDRREAA